jgi:hypothetical protein
MTNGETAVVDKRFGASYADERVGWISVHDSPEIQGSQLINVATATVGESGAALMHTNINGESAYTSQDDSGFESATGLFVAVESDTTVTMHGIYRYIARQKGDSASYIRNNGMSRITEADKHWAHRKAEIPETVRTVLRAHDIEAAYPYVYYNLNIIGTVEPGEFGLFNPRLDEVLVPDPAMNEQTTEQIEVVDKLLSAMQAVKTEDELMARRLTVFSDVPAGQIPDVFVESREKVAGLEKSMRQLLPAVYPATAVYIPAGAGPSGGRDWPYMDPDGKTPAESYGVELSELQAGSTGRASYELKREITEANYRVSRVVKGLGLLRRLSELERQ